LGLELAITNLAENAAARAGFVLSLQIEAPLPDLTPDVEQCFYRVTQESLENIIRHAEAQNVNLQLYHEGNQVKLCIRDDGAGFDPADVDASEKLGLRGMHERATGVGALLEVKSQPQGGTMIHLYVENPS
jgi:signal transduction histidine kinase